MTEVHVHPLRTLWTAAGFRTASALAEAAGVSHVTVGNVERLGAMPSTSVMEKLAAALTMDDAELYRLLAEHRDAVRAAQSRAAEPEPVSWAGDSELPQTAEAV